MERAVWCVHGDPGVRQNDCSAFALLPWRQQRGDRAGGFFFSLRKMSDGQSRSEAVLSRHSLNNVLSHTAVRCILMHYTAAQTKSSNRRRVRHVLALGILSVTDTFNANPTLSLYNALPSATGGLPACLCAARVSWVRIWSGSGFRVGDRLFSLALAT